ncbi:MULTISPECIES: hypothetical protein [unclassified Paenibacillus]|uniref:hypothetical protein n=1 Tax=unclassified Paenibacillus TaxID=185978 RepID=UPI000FE27687|nr:MULTISPECIES: hypothetical protein [unclassified Paenibacillus]MCM3173003.1 hypothetical protein [Paenibacillus sp. MER 99-2]
MQNQTKKILMWINVMLLCAILICILIYFMNNSRQYNEGSPATADSTAVNDTLLSPDEAPLEAEEVNMIGMIETKDSKNLDIYMSASRSNNFGQLPFKQDESFKMDVTSEKVNELEIGLMSISSEQIYSEIVASGTGSVVIKVSESGMYRIYVNNLSPDSVQFKLKLGKAIEGPID